MRFSILHLSDLHRDHEEEQSNSWLLESLDRDRQNYESRGIPKPSICLVTGDLIFGVGRDAADAVQEVERQYRQAEQFLVALCERFFGGDRERVVILPGNHDVFYPGALNAMTPFNTPARREERMRLASELLRPQTTLRWSWADMSFLRVSDDDAYRQRFKAFAEFYGRFYLGQRTYPLEPSLQHHVFDFPDIGFCVLALNSCHGNDPLRRVGTINPDCISAGTRALRQPQRAGWVTAAAWHHNLFGPPASDDYLDAQILQVLIDSGVSLVFHGHQHRQECVDERFRLGPSARKVTVISAGTLCSAGRHLPAGVPRCYNVVELDTDAAKGRVHLREMLNAPPAMALWGPGHIAATDAAHIEFDLCPPMSRRPEKLDATLELEQAERLLGQRKWAEAAERLRPLAGNDLARPLLLKALAELGDVRAVLATLWPPRSVGEAVTIGGIVLGSGSREPAQTYVDTPFVRDSADSSVREMTGRLRERLLR